jgi:hypothetical protein
MVGGYFIDNRNLVFTRYQVVRPYTPVSIEDDVANGNLVVVGHDI